MYVCIYSVCKLAYCITVPPYLSPLLTDTRYGVFCLFKMGNQVMDSSTLADVDKTTMDIVFRDTVILWG